MNRLGSFLWISLALCAPSILRADDASLKFCNKGSAHLYVATASRIQNLITGYRWETSGWYEVAPGQCAVVYSAEYEEAGIVTPQSEARIAYTMVTPQGYWGAFSSDVVDNAGWIKSGTGSICVKRGEAFHSTRPAGNPAANCDGTVIPVAHEFVPPEPGEYTLTVNWEGERDFIPFAVSDGTTARLIYGDEVRYSGNQWRFANGAPVPNKLIDRKSGLPPLLPKWQHSTSEDPAAGYIKEIKDTVSSIRCLDAIKREVSSVQFTMDDFGVAIFSYSYLETGLPESRVSYGAVLANLDLSKISSDDDAGDNSCVSVSLRCKDRIDCVHLQQYRAPGRPLLCKLEIATGQDQRCARRIVVFLP